MLAQKTIVCGIDTLRKFSSTLQLYNTFMVKRNAAVHESTFQRGRDVQLFRRRVGSAKFLHGEWRKQLKATWDGQGDYCGDKECHR